MADVNYGSIADLIYAKLEASGADETVMELASEFREQAQRELSDAPSELQQKLSSIASEIEARPEREPRVMPQREDYRTPSAPQKGIFSMFGGEDEPQTTPKPPVVAPMRNRQNPGGKYPYDNSIFDIMPGGR